MVNMTSSYVIDDRFCMLSKFHWNPNRPLPRKSHLMWQFTAVSFDDPLPNATSREFWIHSKQRIFRSFPFRRRRRCLPTSLSSLCVLAFRISAMPISSLRSLSAVSALYHCSSNAFMRGQKNSNSCPSRLHRQIGKGCKILVPYFCQACCKVLPWLLHC